MSLWSKLLPLKHSIKSVCVQRVTLRIQKSFLFIFTVLAMRQIPEEIGEWQVWWGQPVKNTGIALKYFNASRSAPSLSQPERFAHVLCPHEHKLNAGSLCLLLTWSSRSDGSLGKVEGFSSPSVIFKSVWLISRLCACSRTEFSSWRWEGLFLMELCH